MPKPKDDGLAGAAARLTQLEQLFDAHLYDAAHRLVDADCVVDLRILHGGRVMTGIAYPFARSNEHDKHRVYIQYRSADGTSGSATLEGECSCGARSPCVHVAAVSIAAAKLLRKPLDNRRSDPANNRRGDSPPLSALPRAPLPQYRLPPLGPPYERLPEEGLPPRGLPSYERLQREDWPPHLPGPPPSQTHGPSMRHDPLRQRLCYLVAGSVDAQQASPVAAEYQLSVWVAQASPDAGAVQGACVFTLRNLEREHGGGPGGDPMGEYPRYVDGQDREILATLRARHLVGPWNLQGAAGSALLRQTVATGRALWRSLQAHALRSGAPRRSLFTWEALPSGEQRLNCAASESLVLLLDLEPPVYIDLTSNECGVLEIACSLDLLRQFWDQPAIAPERVASVIECIDLHPQGESFPKPRALRLQRRTPSSVRARLNLSADAAATPQFVYDGIIVDDRSLPVAHRVRHLDGDTVREFERDAESEQRLRAQFEHIVVATPRSSEAWLAFMMNAVPALQALGWEIDIDPGFPYRIASAREWYADVKTSRRDWFDLQLGVTVDGERVNLLPALVSYLQTAGRGAGADGLAADAGGAKGLAGGAGVAAGLTGGGGVAAGLAGSAGVAAGLADAARGAAGLPAGAEAPGLGEAASGAQAPGLAEAAGGVQAPGLSGAAGLAGTVGTAGADGVGEHLFVPLADGRYLPVPLDRIERIANTLVELLDRDGLNGEQSLTLPLSQTGRLAQLALESGVPSLRSDDPSLRALIEDLEHHDGIRPLPAPAHFPATLRPYQQEGLGWLQFLRRHRLGGILADDMGLGKTVQTLAHLATEKAAGRLEKPSLIVAPVSVLGNWQQEIGRLAPALRLLTWHGAKRKALLSRMETAEVVITGYPMLLLDSEILLARQFYFLILDEAQMIKNPRSKVSQVARALRADHRLCLTGTPMQNHLGELWSLLDFAQPGLLGDEQQFQRHYRSPIEKGGDGPRARALSRRIGPFLLRRTKDAVAHDLPPKMQILESIVLDERQRDFYDGIRLAMHRRVRDAVQRQGLARSHITVLDALLKLRQACCDPRLVGADMQAAAIPSAKLDWLSTALPEMIAEGRRILLFSQFTSMLRLIEVLVTGLSIPYCLLTGGTQNRTALIQQFQAGGVPLFLISLKAGGTGLNLTVADTVIHYDPWWNEAAEAQATDRAHRIGQDKRVFVYKLIAHGTVEEKIMQLQDDKHALVSRIYSGRNAAPASWSAADLEVLFAS